MGHSGQGCCRGDFRGKSDIRRVQWLAIIKGVENSIRQDRRRTNKLSDRENEDSEGKRKERLLGQRLSRRLSGNAPLQKNNVI